MAQRVFHFYQDPGHGWIKVPVKLLRELGMLSEISDYSYYKNGNVFLEEDRDASLFTTIMNVYEKEVKFNEHHTDNSSRIRSYAHYDKHKQKIRED